MSNKNELEKHEIDNLYKKIKDDAEAFGYQLNPDIEFTKDLIKGLIININRYGYPSCPCRLSSGKKSEDLDIICPCDYRDPDLNEFDACYCALYVSKRVINGEKDLTSIPERRGVDVKKQKNKMIDKNNISLSVPIWRCKVCGYLCARENPPEICPICKVKKDRFELFIT
jgi:ferredoxin-thioredoxin reductase catalytic subunit